MKGYLVRASGCDPYENLALEEHLFSYAADDQVLLLYLWQNDRTVVIGRNQNAYTECNLTYAHENDIRIARRMTGGGAVYHDLGNVNYTMILPKQMYDIGRSTGVIVRALNGLGIAAEKNGRNDICVGGAKISGNAYHTDERAGLHHGTILCRADTDMMDRLFDVKGNKMTLKGIGSVRARVTDIDSVCSGIDVSHIQGAIAGSFKEEYGLTDLETMDVSRYIYEDLIRKYSSKEWNLDRIRDYKTSSEGLYDWGSVHVSMECKGNLIRNAAVSSDSLKADLIQELGDVMAGCLKDRTREEALGYIREYMNGYEGSDREVTDICGLIIDMLEEHRQDRWKRK